MRPFQQFQHDFGQHLRDPHHRPRPAGIGARPAGVYAELLFNNLRGFLDACYPVTRATLGPQRWQRLMRAFFREARCQSPWFREIPKAFLDWLNASDRPRLLQLLALTAMEEPVSFEAHHLRAEKEKVLSSVRLPKDLAANTAAPHESNLAAADSTTRVFVVPANEELVVAREAARLLAARRAS